MATYHLPKYKPCDAGDLFGPLYYSFFNCIEDAVGCPPPPPFDPAYGCGTVQAAVAGCCAGGVGAAWLPQPIVFGCIADYPGGPDTAAGCYWIDGYVGTTGGGEILVADGFVLNATPLTPGGTNPAAIWAACGALGAGDALHGWVLDPTQPDCRCQDSPLHCVDADYAWDPIGQGAFCESYCPGCFDFGAFDPATGLCKSGLDDGSCPAGTHWDPVCRECVSDVPPRKCWVWKDCRWQPPGTCGGRFVFDTASCSCYCPARSCSGNSFLDPLTCTCQPCPFGECWCATEQRCVTCTDPPCKTARACVWDVTACDWNCLPMPPGSSGCAVGEHYDLKACRCVPDCPPNECWCEATSSCMACTPPDCWRELKCLWDVDACDWVCQPPPCIAPATWTGPPLCKCVGGEKGPWNLFTTYHNYHAASDEHGILYERSNSAIPPFAASVQVTSDPAHSQARMIRDWRHRKLLLYTDASGGSPSVREIVSDDDGDTFSHPRTIFVSGKHPMPAGPQPFSGCTVYAAYDGGNLVATRRYPGDTVDSDQFTFVDDTGTPLAVDDASFGLSASWDGPGRWNLHVLQGGNRHHWESTDDCSTWLDVT